MSTIEWKNKDSVLAHVAKWPLMFEDELVHGLRVIGVVVRGQVVEKTPSNDGTLKAGIYASDPYPTPSGWAVGVGDSVEYGGVIEHGRRPGERPPPYMALVPWVWSHRSLFSGVWTEEDCVGVAIALARKIGKRGFSSAPDGQGKGWGMYAKAEKSAKGDANRILDATKRRIEQRLSEVTG